MSFYFTLRQTAELLNVKVRTVRQWIRDGKMEATHIDGSRKLYVTSKEIGRINAERSREV